MPAVPDFVSDVISLKYASAAKVAAALNALGADSKSPTPSRLKERLEHTLYAADVEREIRQLGWRAIGTDERSNSLLVFASPSDLARIKAIIAKLDVALAQVLVEAVILQFPLNDPAGLSLEPAQSSRIASPSAVFTALTQLTVLSTNRFAPGEASYTLGRPRYDFSDVATFSGDWDAATSALANYKGVRILQTPRIQTSDGEPASMFVGMALRSSGSYSGGGAACGCHAAIDLLASGVALEVTCMLTTDGVVLTEIKQEVDSVAGTVTITNVGDVPVVTNRNSEALVALHDREIIMLGGYIEKVRTPLFPAIQRLDRAPRVRGFLNSLITSPKRTTYYQLMVLIRPTVLPAPETPVWLPKVEKSRYPGSIQMERQFQAEELKRLQVVERDSNN
jgi:general secretion pathway protein D